MTVYGARGGRRWMRPTLRLRLTLLNGVLLIGGALLLVLLAWLLVGDALGAAANLQPASKVVLANGQPFDADMWLSQITAATQRDLLLNGFIAVLAVSVVGVAGAYVIAGRALRPLQQVTSTAQHLTGETLDQRIRYVGADDEVAELAATFDAMLDRISTTFETQKRFVANASHELRTPLAVMRTEVDVTLADPDADIAEFRRMANVVLRGSERANALVDLSTGVSSALSATSKEADRIHLVTETSLEAAPVVGDPGLLDRLAGNLIENAVRYNHLHGRIWVRTGADSTHAWLVVKNTGFEVDPTDVPGLFEPFRRGGFERTGGRGSGLGLSIVRAVVDAHGGTVSAVANPGGGLEVTVTLPAAATTPVVAASATVPQR
jgi:signal transduction histidine kinase